LTGAVSAGSVNDGCMVMGDCSGMDSEAMFGSPSALRKGGADGGDGDAWRALGNTLTDLLSENTALRYENARLIRQVQALTRRLGAEAQPVRYGSAD